MAKPAAPYRPGGQPPGQPSATPPGVVSQPVVVNPGVPTPGVTYPAPVVPNPVSTPGALVWDADQKDVHAQPGQMSVPFTFYFTNVSSSEVIINSVRTSCGCTAAKLPPMPWKIPPGTNLPLEITMNVAGKVGVVPKTVTVDSTAGTKVLVVRANLPTPTPPAATGLPQPGQNKMAGEAERVRNQQMALADRQAVFRGDCASCHVRPGEGKMGKELFAAVCGVCHDAEHRASMVPDLKNLDHATDADHWRTWITFGRVGSLMPSFAKAEGGPLTDQQIASLVDYLVTAIPGKPHPASPQQAAQATSVVPLPQSK